MQNTPGIEQYSVFQFIFSPSWWHLWSCSVATSRRTVVLLGGSWWKHVEQATHLSLDDMVVGNVNSGHWEHGGGALGTEQRGGYNGTADALRHFKQSGGFPLISQRLQSSTEKAATWRRNRFNFNHLSYSAAYTHSKTHTQKQVYTGLSPKADFSDNLSGEQSRTFGTYTAAQCFWKQTDFWVIIFINFLHGQQNHPRVLLALNTFLKFIVVLATSNVM